MREISSIAAVAKMGGSGSNPAAPAHLTPENPGVFAQGGVSDPPASAIKVPENPAEPGPGATSEAEAQPRRCAEPERDAEGRDWPCGAALAGAALDCSVCAGSRCYGHCGSVDHMGGTLFVEFGANGFTARVRRLRDTGGEFDMGRFAGHLRSNRTGRVIAKGIEGDDPEEVLRELRDLIPLEAPPAPAPAAPVPLADCRRRSAEHRAVVAAAQILAKANMCPCEGCAGIVRVFNLIVIPRLAGKAVR